jgi:hypothetical protein
MDDERDGATNEDHGTRDERLERLVLAYFSAPTRAEEHAAKRALLEYVAR